VVTCPIHPKVYYLLDFEIDTLITLLKEIITMLKNKEINPGHNTDYTLKNGGTDLRRGPSNPSLKEGFRKEIHSLEADNNAKKI